MNKDRKIAYTNCEISGDSTQFTLLYKCDSLPFWIEEQGINRWINGRHSPLSRKNIRRLFEDAGIINIKDYVDKTKAISLNDTIWIKKDGDSTKWSDINPYKMPFNRIIANIAFGTGMGNVDKLVESPELSTGGAYAKCWKRIDNEIYMLKLGRNELVDEFDNEPFSEYFTQQVAKQIGIREYAEYDLGLSKNGRVLSKSKLFTSEDVGLITMGNIMGDFSLEYKYCFEYMKRLGSETAFRQMMILDAIVLNTDRHANNFGVFIDNNTFNVIRMASIYDHNCALLPNLNLNNEKEHIKHVISNTTSFTKQDLFDLANKYVTLDILNNIENIANGKFKLNQHPNIKMEQSRFEFMNKLIQYNARKIIRKYNETILK